MSVLIKGMKMPPKGEYTATIYVDSDGTAYIDFDSREMNEYTVYDEKCDLVEVPPHGRLVDADALKKKWLEAENRMGADKVLSLPVECFIRYGCVYDLEDAPTIIPAEEDGT